MHTSCLHIAGPGLHRSAAPTAGASCRAPCLGLWDGRSPRGVEVNARQVRRPRPRAVRPAALFDFFKKKAPIAPVVRETIIPEPSYNLPIGLGALAAFSAVEGNAVLAALLATLGAFLAVQASRVRFKFYDDSLEVVIGDQEQETENAFVGGENRWAFDTFTNWEFWWPNFPILVYFKETQTKPEGQIHFFPVLFKNIYPVMVERCGPSQNSGPKRAAAE